MKHYVIIYTILYIMGIAAYVKECTILFAAVLACLSVYLLLKGIKPKYVYIYLTAFILGLFNAALNIKYDNPAAPFADSVITAEAEVISIPSNNIKDKTQFYAITDYIQTETGGAFSDKTKIFVTINDDFEKLSEIKTGSKLKLKGRLKNPMRAQNPYQFDYAEYLRYKKTFSLLYVKNDWSIISRAQDFKGKFLSRLNDTRNRIIKIHAQNIKSPMLEVLGGIIFGDDAVNPDEDTKNSFINSGIFHILAASGMNVTLIFGIWFFLAQRLKFNYKFSIITGMLLVIFYTFMTGFGPPVIRASIMLELIMAGKLIYRETNTMSLLFAAGFLMLAFNPLMLFDTGFQLSFIVTFALILTAPLISFKFSRKWINNILGACLIPVIAQIYAAPLQIFYFGVFTLYSVFANIAVIPVLSIVSFLGFISSIIALIPAAAKISCFTADLILNPLLIYIVKTAEFFSSLPNAVLYCPKPPVFQIFLFYAVITGIICLWRYKLKNKKFYAVLAASAVIFAAGFINIPDKNAEILYFSIGNADSFLVKTPENKYIMIDTGKPGYNGTNSAAENIIIKYMRNNGIKELNALILSHFDSDHAGGAADIMRKIKVKKLYITDVYENTQVYEDIKNCTEKFNIDEEIITSEKEIYRSKDFIVTILKPEGNLIKTENQKSLAVHIKTKGGNFLFTGDGDINSYNVLEDKFKKDIKIIKSGHHGAKNTINREMTENSEIFLLSTGANNYNHPHPETIKIIKEGKRKYLRTDKHNAVRVVIKNKKSIIQLFSSKKKRFEIYNF